MINVTVNNQQYRFDFEITIEDLLKKLNIKKTGTAVAVNNKVVSRSQHNIYKITDNDNLEIIRAVGGG